MNPHSYTLLILDKGLKKYYGEKSFFNKCCSEKCLSAYRKLKLDPCLSLYTSINLKWIEDLNIRPEALKLIQKKAGNTLQAIHIGKDFLSETQAAQKLRERIEKWDYMKLKFFAQ
jgi:hypothetical protein